MLDLPKQNIHAANTAKQKQLKTILHDKCTAYSNTIFKQF
jgi:hypothetical protein